MEERDGWGGGFSEKLMEGHWIKLVEVGVGLAMLVMGVLWQRGLCMGREVEAGTIAIGVALVIVACVGLAGLVLHVGALLWVHLGALLLVLLLMLSMTLFTLEATRGHLHNQDIHLSDFPAWFQHQVASHGHWHHIISSCINSSLCSSISTSPTPFPSMLQSGCCEPPLTCNFTHVEAKNWISSNSSISTNVDCTTWNNNPSELCYYCDSCKAVVVYTTWKQWKKYRSLLLISISTILISYAFCGCGLFKQEVAHV